jgi:hypothetical protein
MPWSRREVLLSGAIALVAGRASAETSETTSDQVRTTRIQKLQEFYARVYGEPLNSPERLPREIAIVSLARIDSPETTSRLFDVFKSRDRDPVIQFLAWEALHARCASLTTDQRRRWVTAGLKTALAGAFPQATVAPLLLAMSEHAPAALEAEPGQLAMRVVQENDLAEDSSKRALDGLKQLVAAWHDPRLVRAIVAVLAKKPQLAKRVDYVLRGLPDPPPEGEDPRKAWNASSRRVANLKAATAEELKPYAGKSTLLPAAAKITDPDDKRWRAELEISKLTVSDFDLVWCIDSTGSMNDENQLVAKETGLVLRVCSLVSKRARCGVIYFRHETDTSLMQPCCERIKSNSGLGWYQVKGYPLNAKPAELSAKMSAERIPRPDPQNEGNVHPGSAVHAAIKAAMEQMPWSKDRGARKAIVLVGDSHVTPGSEDACAKIGREAKSRGFQVHALVKGGAIRSWEKTVESAGGEQIPFATADDLKAMEAREDERPGLRRRRLMMASEGDPHTVFARVAAVVIGNSVSPAYRDRAEPLVKVLQAYAEAMAHAERAGAVHD